MARYKIFDPKTETLQSIKEKLEKSKDLVTRCELALYLRQNPKSERQVVILSYCISTCLQLLDELRIAKAQSNSHNAEVYEAKLAEIDEKLEKLRKEPKETKTYKAVVESLTRQHSEYSRLVEFGDIPKSNQKHLVTLELLLKRINECLEKLDADGVRYSHLISTFPRLNQLMED